jgi:hypothetical protein
VFWIFLSAFDPAVAEELHGRTAAASLCAAPIVVNGGFEKGMAPWWGPSGEIVYENPGEGRASLKITDHFTVQEAIRPVEGGCRYRISMRIRSENAPAESVFVQVSYRGPGVDPGWRGADQVSVEGRQEPALLKTGGTHGWRPFSAVVETPPGVDQMLIYLRKLDGTPGAAFYDLVEVQPTNDPVMSTALLRQQTLAAELLPPSVSPAQATQALNAAVVGASRGGTAPITLVENGQSRYHIHVGTEADVITLNAASDLASYLQKISGGVFTPLSHDGNTKTGPLLIVGRDNALVQRLCPDIDFDKLGTDGFLIRTVGSDVVIAGATSRGTMYGVNWFIDRKLGVRWLSPDFTYVPSAKTIRLAPINEDQIPWFGYREVLSVEGQDKPFRAHNLLNGESHGPSFSPSPPEIDSWDHSWSVKGSSANFFELLPPDRNSKHPDWYAGGQVAMMNTSMRDAMADAIVQRLKEYPNYRDIWFDVHDMDWGWDMDPASKSFADLHGGQPSAPRLDMMIYLADRVRTALPEARLAFNAYHWSFAPPTGMTVPDYVLVSPMTIQVDYSSALNAGRNAQLGEDLAGWTAIAKHVLVWDHITNFSGFLQPTPNLYPIGRSLQWLATLPNVTGYFAEGSWNTPGAEFASLRAWLISRLLWDPHLPVDSLISEYCADYFGTAGSIIKSYIDLEHAAIAKSGDILSEKTPVEMRMLNLHFIMSADRLFDQAEVAVANLPIILAHVREARMPLDYVILVRRSEYEAAAAAQGVVWQPDTVRRLARLRETIQSVGVTQYRQGGDLGELWELLSVDRTKAEVPELVRDLPTSDWVDFQDLSLTRYDSTRIVEDPEASDHAAARMPGNSPTWAVQLSLRNLPPRGAWDLYAAVRVDAEPGHGDQVGVHVGSFPPMGLYNTELISTLGDGHYHMIKFSGGPFRYSFDRSSGIYLQSPNVSFIRYLYVDRIIAIKVADTP